MSTQKEIDTIASFFSHLTNCRDVDNVIIKGHILTEYAMQIYIDKKAIEKINFKKVYTTYANKIEMSRLLGLFKENSELNTTLKHLNKLRNSLAHNLKYDENDLLKFLKGFEKYKDTFEDKRVEKLQQGNKTYYIVGDDKIKVDEVHIILIHYISSLCTEIFLLSTK